MQSLGYREVYATGAGKFFAAGKDFLNFAI
jgi:hypothetical protein